MIAKPRGPWTPPETAKEKFDKLNRAVRALSGWITSVPGDPEVVLECLPGSTLPDVLREKGYTLTEIGEGERILLHAITTTVITEGSTVPIRTQHAGITRVQRFSFSIS